MASRKWTVTFHAPKCDGCGGEEAPCEDGSPVYLRNAAERAGWWARHAASDDLFMLCPSCRRLIAGKLQP